ncbi:MAG: dihydrolipoamide acetyltransferase family protein, partial [Maricaulaceae bacterium]
RPPKPPSTPAAAPAPERTRPVREGRPLASPAVRQRARDADIDLGFVPGTGPAGRITHEDLEDFIASGGRLSQFAAGPTAAGPAKAKRTGVHDVRIIGLRRKIAENMARSAREIPHIAYVEEIDVTAVEALRKHLNATKRDDQPKLTFLPFLCAAMAKALPEFPQANAHYDADAGVLTQYDAAHIGVATATPNGLMVPVVRHAEALDLWETSAEIKRLSDAARQGACAREELSGSSITITSLGAIGGIVTTPIINYPETAIIGVNKMVERPAFDAGGRVVPRLFMNLSSSFDHRIVDGFEAASLVQRLKGLLENPATLFM